MDASTLATALLGDSIAANLFVVGFAFQRGLLPLGLESIDAAIALNGVAVETNRRAVAWGRAAAVDLERVLGAAQPRLGAAPMPVEETDLAAIVAVRERFLTQYQNEAYARRYTMLVERVEAEERRKAKGLGGITQAVARNYFKLLAYKDEYEVARLYTAESFRAALDRQFEGDYKLRYHLAPPLLAKRDPHSGHPLKREYGPWVMQAFKVLARLKPLRGTVLDPFGHTAERKRERQLISEYEDMLDEVLGLLNIANHPAAVRLAEIPDQIRGFGHVKLQSIDTAKAEQRQLLQAYRSGEPTDSRSVA